MMIPSKHNGYSRDGTRLCFKGGDGGAADAKAAEADRQARISSSVERINNIFDSKPYTIGTGRATAFDPNQAYFREDGTRYTAPSVTEAVPEGMDILGNPINIVSRTTTDANDVNQAMSKGLFTGFETVQPTQNRQQLYDQQKTAVFDLNKRDVDRQFKEAERATRFGLARSGLSGGSEDIDAKARLQDINNEGLIKATGLGDAAAADLRTADERSRQSLISMAQSGIDTGTAQGMALRNLDATAQSAAGNRAGASIGDLFGGLGQAYMMRNGLQGMQAGARQNQYDQKYGNLNTSRGDTGSVNPT